MVALEHSGRPSAEPADPFHPGGATGPADRPAPGNALDALAGRAQGQATAENFPVALRLLPRGPREALMRVYGFARFVDDVGDEFPGGPADRAVHLDLIERDLRAVPAGAARLPAVRGIAPLVRRHGVPLQPFLDLVEASRADQVVTSYATFDDLLGYCRLSAVPVGVIVLHLAAAATEANLADSAAVCSALQILEHCQDVGEDAAAGRVYLPADDLAAAGVERARLAERGTGPQVRQVVRLQAQRAEQMLRSGRPLVRRLHGWARIAVAGYVAGGAATATALHRADYRVLERPVRPSRLVTAARAAALLTGVDR